MGYKHSREDILDGALNAAFDDGLSRLTFGRLAKRLGISDRVIVYYFPTKDDLVGEVVVSMGIRLQETLAAAFTKVAPDYLELARLAWPIVATVEADPVFALFFEANGLAAAGTEPYAGLIPLLLTAWVDWLADFLDGSRERRQAEAQAAIALLDGLLLLRQLAGADAAERAAITVGVSTA